MPPTQEKLTGLRYPGGLAGSHSRTMKKRGQVLAHGFVEGETAQPNNRLQRLALCTAAEPDR